jgi:hypothetical protein
MATATTHRRPPDATPLAPERRWRAIAIATALVAPAIWLLLGGLVAAAADDGPSATAAAVAIVVGLSLLPFAFRVLAIGSEQPDPGRAAARAMGLCLLVGIPVSALAGDAISGIVAGVGAGGIVALHADDDHAWRARACAVALGTAYAFVLARVAGPVVVIFAPVFPFTSLGLADHWTEWRRDRVGQGDPPLGPE